MKTAKKKAEQLTKRKYNDEFIFSLIEACDENINSLVQEAKLLLDNKFYARSFALSYSALEELGKRLLCCDYYENVISEKEFEDGFADHKLKISYIYNNCNLTPTDNGFDATIIYDKNKYSYLFEARNIAMYVDKKGTKIIQPLIEIEKKNAEDIYNHLLQHIQKTNYYETINERLGSKAFYK